LIVPIGRIGHDRLRPYCLRIVVLENSSKLKTPS
jgi:hypothetical protein